MKKLVKFVLAIALMFTCSVNPVWAAGSQTANNTVVDVKDKDGNEPTDYTVVFDSTVEIAGSNVEDLEKVDYSLLTNDVLVAKDANGDQVDVEDVTVTFEVPNLVAGAIEVYGNTGEGWDLLDATVDVDSKTITATFEKLPSEIAVMYAKADKAALRAKVAEVKAMDMSKYTAETKTVVATALTAAETVLANADASQADVDAALKALTDAVKGLKVAFPFTDVPENEWFYGSVEKAYALGLMGATGAGADKFEPNVNISRGMVATVLYRMAGKPKVTTSNTFSDVEANLWYTASIEWAASAKVVSGYGNTGKFGPDDQVLRQDLAIMLRNYAKAQGIDTNAKVDFSAFKDGSTVDSYAASAVAWCVEAGLMSGSTKADGKYLQPKANATRAECAKMFSLLAGLN